MVRHLYFHIPFCLRICPYCSFYKHRPGKLAYGRFADALIRELDYHRQRMAIEAETIYFGGGTPSMLPARVWRGLTRAMGDSIDLSKVDEWTLEANPRTFDANKVESWAQTGVTRVSLGVQSFDAATLQVLGRDHGPRHIAQAVADLGRSGGLEINLDLMFSVPGQIESVWRDSLSRAIDLEPVHISAYNLTYEQDTEFLSRFETGEWTADSDRDAEFFLLADDLLTAAGFEHYEVSNYAKPGFRSRHNQAYWQGRDYLGLGPSAVSTGSGERWRNVASTADYVRRVEAHGQAIGGVERLTDEQFALERLALQLRTSRGVSLGDSAAGKASRLIGEGLAHHCGGRLVLTAAGMMVADEIAAFLA